MYVIRVQGISVTGKKKKAHVVGIYIGQSVLQEVFHKKSILAVTQELCQVTG